MKQKTVYVFGEGLVGSRIIEHLKKDQELNVISSHEAPLGHRIFSTPAAHDISKILADLISGRGKPDIIINTIGVVGKPNVEWCETNKTKTRYGNVDIAVDMAWAATKLNVPFIHISTGCIFNDFNGREFLPNDEPNFLGSYYSRTKAEGEYQLGLLHKDYPNSRIEIHRIRMPFFKESDPRNLINKLITYPVLVDSKNSMTSLEDYAVFMNQRVKEILAEAPSEEGWIKALHATNKGALKHSEIIDMIRKDNRIAMPIKKYISPQQLNEMCGVPRSNCILAEGQLPDVRESMLKTISEYQYE